MQRLSYFLKRLLLIIPTFIGITLVVSGLIQFVPGGPVEQRMMQMRSIGEGGEGGAAGVSADASARLTEEYRRELEKRFRFDQPFHVRYWHWLVTDRLGMRMESYLFTGNTAWQLIRSRLAVSLIFGITGFLLSYMICIPLGIAKALRNGTGFDFTSSILVFTGYAIPTVALGMLLRALFTGVIEDFPALLPLGGFQSEHYQELSCFGRLLDRARHMALPLTCYVAGNFAVLTMLMKNTLLDQISRDYVRTVFAKGGDRKRAVWGHALRNAMIPIATGFGGIMTVMFAGSVIIERIFEIPGMGRLSLDAITGRDYAVFMGILSLTSILGLIGNILSDFCYVLIDPRITFDR
jgi:microcin C transport system permease protein